MQTFRIVENCCVCRGPVGVWVPDCFLHAIDPVEAHIGIHTFMCHECSTEVCDRMITPRRLRAEMRGRHGRV